MCQSSGLVLESWLCWVDGARAALGAHSLVLSTSLSSRLGSQRAGKVGKAKLPAEICVLLCIPLYETEARGFGV